MCVHRLLDLRDVAIDDLLCTIGLCYRTQLALMSVPALLIVRATELVPIAVRSEDFIAPKTRLHFAVSSRKVLSLVTLVALFPYSQFHTQNYAPRTHFVKLYF
jgi:hypothetical protein